MARYIDADLIPYTDDDDYLSQYAYRYDIDEVPTADVVPKSEYDAAIIDRNAARLGMIAEHERLKTAKAEVAREIFEEVEKIRLREIHRCEVMRKKEVTNLQRMYWEGGEHSLRQLSYWISELKKKYTEVAE